MSASLPSILFLLPSHIIHLECLDGKIDSLHIIENLFFYLIFLTLLLVLYYFIVPAIASN